MRSCNRKDCICFQQNKQLCRISEKEEYFLWDKFHIGCPVKINANDDNDYDFIKEQLIKYRESLKEKNEFLCYEYDCVCINSYTFCCQTYVEREFLLNNYNIECPLKSCMKNKEEYINMLNGFKEFQESIKIMKKLRE